MNRFKVLFLCGVVLASTVLTAPPVYSQDPEVLKELESTIDFAGHLKNDMARTRKKYRTYTVDRSYQFHIIGKDAIQANNRDHLKEARNKLWKISVAADKEIAYLEKLRKTYPDKYHADIDMWIGYWKKLSKRAMKECFELHDKFKQLFGKIPNKPLDQLDPYHLERKSVSAYVDHFSNEGRHIKMAEHAVKNCDKKAFDKALKSLKAIQKSAASHEKAITGKLNHAEVKKDKTLGKNLNNLKNNWKKLHQSATQAIKKLEASFSKNCTKRKVSEAGFKRSIYLARLNQCDRQAYTNYWTQLFNQVTDEANKLKGLQGAEREQQAQLVGQMTASMDKLRADHIENCVKKATLVTTHEFSDKPTFQDPGFEVETITTSVVYEDDDQDIALTSTDIIEDDRPLHERLGLSLPTELLRPDFFDGYWMMGDSYEPLHPDSLVDEMAFDMNLEPDMDMTATLPDDAVPQGQPKTETPQTSSMPEDTVKTGEPEKTGETAMGEDGFDEACMNTIEQYKTELRSLGAQGWHPSKPPHKGTWVVTLAYDLNRTGSVDNVKVTKSSGDPKLDQSAVSKVKSMSGQFPPIPTCYTEQHLEIDHAFKVIYR